MDKPRAPLGSGQFDIVNVAHRLAGLGHKFLQMNVPS